MPYFHCDPYLIIPHSYRPIQWMTLLTFFLSRRSDQIMSRISLCPVDCLLIDIYTLNLLNTIDRYFYKKKKSQTLTFIYMYQHKSVEPHGHSS